MLQSRTDHRIIVTDLYHTFFLLYLAHIGKHKEKQVVTAQYYSSPISTQF